jgi:glycosyltransferase involved in cell wall biosynthesis
MAEHVSEQRIRVLMTADAVGGVWSYALDLSRVLADYRVDILLAVMGPPPSASQREQALSVSNLQLVVKDFPLEWFYDFSDGDMGRSAAWLRNLARDFKADLVHVNGYAHAAGQWHIPVLAIAHSCVYSWWKAVYRTEPPCEYAGYRQRVEAGLRAASAVIAPSAWMLDVLERTYNVALRKSKAIHNFTNLAALPEPSNKEPVIFACGRFWDRAKNLKLLDHVANELAWPVHVAGSRWGPEGTEETSAHLKLLGQLPHSEVLQQLSRAAIFAHPALYEPFGLAVLEAAASGCALVLADISSLRELWEGAALFISPDDARGWAKWLDLLARNETSRIRLSEAALRRSREFEAESSGRQYFELYRELLNAAEPSNKPILEINEPSSQTVLPLHRF